MAGRIFHRVTALNKSDTRTLLEDLSAPAKEAVGQTPCERQREEKLAQEKPASHSSLLPQVNSMKILPFLHSSKNREGDGKWGGAGDRKIEEKGRVAKHQGFACMNLSLPPARLTWPNPEICGCVPKMQWGGVLEGTLIRGGKEAPSFGFHSPASLAQHTRPCSAGQSEEFRGGGRWRKSCPPYHRLLPGRLGKAQLCGAELTGSSS